MTLKPGDRVWRVKAPNTTMVPIGSTGTVTSEPYNTSEFGDHWSVNVRWDHLTERDTDYVQNYIQYLERIQATVLPAEDDARKALPVASGVLDYFPAALVEVAKVSQAGNEQHSPGQPLHWARGKSSNHADALLRHLLERGAIDADGQRHSAKVAWRALALLQEELEREGAPQARGAW